MKQRPGQDLEQHATHFEAQCKAVEVLWGRMVPWSMVGEPTDKQEQAWNNFKACMFLGSVEEKYRKVIVDLHSYFLNGEDKYPDTIAGVVTLLKKRLDVGGRSRQLDANFSQVAEESQSGDAESNDDDEDSQQQTSDENEENDSDESP